MTQTQTLETQLNFSPLLGGVTIPSAPSQLRERIVDPEAAERLEEIANKLSQQVDCLGDSAPPNTRRKVYQAEQKMHKRDKLYWAQVLAEELAKGHRSGEIHALLRPLRRTNQLLWLAEYAAKYYLDEDQIKVLLPEDTRNKTDFELKAILANDRDYYSEEHRNILKPCKIATLDQFNRLLELCFNLLPIPEGEEFNRRKATRMRWELVGSKIPDFFPTPPDVIRRMLYHVRLQDGDRVLEPSGGWGSLCDAITAEAQIQGVNIELNVLEVNYTLNQILQNLGYNVIGRDFIDSQLKPGYNLAFMNPPFSDDAYITHTRRAHDLLVPGGKVVSITPNSWLHTAQNNRGTAKTKKQKAQVAFYDWILENGGTYELMAEDAFQKGEIKTGVRTIMVVVPKR